MIWDPLQSEAIIAGRWDVDVTSCFPSGPVWLCDGLCWKRFHKNVKHRAVSHCSVLSLFFDSWTRHGLRVSQIWKWMLKKLFSLSTTVLLYNLNEYRWFAVCDARARGFRGRFTLLELKKKVGIGFFTMRHHRPRWKQSYHFFFYRKKISFSHHPMLAHRRHGGIILFFSLFRSGNTCVLFARWIYLTAKIVHSIRL